MWISNLRLFCRYSGFGGFLFIVLLILVTCEVYRKYETQSLYLTTFPMALLLISLTPPITNVLWGFAETLPQYVVGGVRPTEIIIINNLTTLFLSGLGVATIVLALWVSLDDVWPHCSFPLSYFGISIFPLIILGNYISVFRHLLGLKNDGTLMRQMCVNTVLVGLASIPYLLTQFVFESNAMYWIIFALNIAVWYVTTVRFLSALAARYLAHSMENGK